VGGLVAANLLRQQLPNEDHVILVDREPRHLFQPSLLWLAVGQREPERIQRPLDRLRRKGIEVVIGKLSALDSANRVVRVNGRELSGDAIIVSLGAELAPQMIPGLETAGLNLYTLEGANAIRAALQSFTGGRIVLLTAAPAYKCPAAPYEAAMLIEALLRQRGVRDRTRLDLYAAEPGQWAWPAPMYRLLCGGWSSRKAWAITLSTR
jgi:sulfide:quinone oxidoreductase